MRQFVQKLRYTQKTIPDTQKTEPSTQKTSPSTQETNPSTQKTNPGTRPQKIQKNSKHMPFPAGYFQACGSVGRLSSMVIDGYYRRLADGAVHTTTAAWRTLAKKGCVLG